MKSIDFLEHGGGFFHIRRHGELIPLADPRTLHFQIVLAALNDRVTPGLPEGAAALWQLDLVFQRWCAAWDLPSFADARRLAYLVDHYRPAIAHDLSLRNLDLGELWRARRWTLLLDIIDRLPSHSWYAASVSMDEEHAKMLAEAIAQRDANSEEKPESKGPPLTSWTPEMAMLTNVYDAVRGVQHAVVAVQSERGKMPEPPKPAPRPVTPLERALKRAEYERRKAKHESLVARVLPKKRAVKAPSTG